MAGKDLNPISARPILIKAGLAFNLAVGLWLLPVLFKPAAAQSITQEADVLHGKEHEFGDAFILSLGGKLFDDFWLASDAAPPKRRNPEFPPDITASDKDTWRCVSCHGWDYDGADKKAGSEQQRRQFVSLRHLHEVYPFKVLERFNKAHAGHPAKQNAGVALDLLVMFVSSGQYKTRDFGGAKPLETDKFNRARDIYEGTCMACHDPEGRSGLEAQTGAQQSLGWLARNKPERTMHKIINGAPGQGMLSLRFLDETVIADVIRYLKTLDPGAEQSNVKPGELKVE